MTDTPEVKVKPPAYMCQKSVSAFSQHGVSAAAADPSWTALPGSKPAHLLTSSSAATVQPVSNKVAIAMQNAELLRVAAEEAAARTRVDMVSLFSNVLRTADASGAFEPKYSVTPLTGASLLVN